MGAQKARDCHMACEEGDQLCHRACPHPLKHKLQKCKALEEVGACHKKCGMDFACHHSCPKMDTLWHMKKEHIYKKGFFYMKEAINHMLQKKPVDAKDEA